jgi:putative DNA primase/helicase
LAVLAISHLNKSGGTRAITRIMGSQEWAAAPRAIFLVTQEPGIGRRLFLPLKNNLARDRIGYAFEINDMIVGDGIATSAAVWGEPVTISADDALVAGGVQKTGMWAAVEFLIQALSEGPVDQAEIVRLREEAGFTAKNLRTAREKLGIKPKKEGFGAEGRWIWPPPSHLRLVVDNESDDPPDNVDPSDSRRCRHQRLRRRHRRWSR